MVITAGRKERRLPSVALRKFEAQHVAIKGDRPFQIRHFQMDMPNPNLWMNRFHLVLLYNSTSLEVVRCRSGESARHGEGRQCVRRGF